MSFFSSLLPLLSLSAVAFAVPVPSLRATRTLSARSGCASNLNEASAIFSLLGAPGVSGWSEHWTDANILEDVYNYALASGDDQYSGWIDGALFEYNPTVFSVVGPSTFFDGSNDDALWAALMYMKYWDYLQTTGQGGSDDASTSQANVEAIYSYVSQAYNTGLCGGGILWTQGGNYLNAVTNALFLLVSAAGYQRWGDETWLTNAQDEWAWLESSGMRNSAGLWNDGLDASTCQNNGQTVWTYSQGVMASGLGYLYTVTGNSTLLDQAEITLDAVFDSSNGLVSGGILKESCDNTDTSSFSCDADQQIFKGVFMKHLQYYLDQANDADTTSKYSPMIGAQTSAVYHYGIESSGNASPVWYGPNDVSTSSQSDASAIEAYLAGAKYTSC